MSLIPAFDPLYRIWHLRKVWQLCLIPPMLGVLAATLYPDRLAALSTPFGAGLLLSLWAVGSALHLILWPRLPVEVLAWSVTLGLLLAVAPGILHTRDGSAFSLVWLAALAAPLGLALNHLILTLMFRGPTVGRHYSASASTRLGPEHILQSLRLGPDQSGPFAETGPACNDGSFTVHLPVPVQIDSRRAAGLWSCTARLVDESALHQLQALVPVAEPHKETRILLRAEADGDGARIFVDEFETGLPLGCALLFGLTGMHDDMLRARIDHAEGRPSQAIRAATQTSPLRAIGEWVTPLREG